MTDTTYRWSSEERGPTPEGTNTMRIERYYNSLLGNSPKSNVAPTINEARKDLHRAIEAQYAIVIA